MMTAEVHVDHQDGVAPQLQQQQQQQQNGGSSVRTGARNLLLVSLSRFYSQKGTMDRVMPYIAGTSEVSLRLIDWFVTNYAKKNNSIITHRDAHGNVIHFNVYLSYRSQLKAYSKQQFDPFRRRDRILFYHDDNNNFVETTVGQLNFFRWMLQNRILDYIVANASTIETDMMGIAAPAPSATHETAHRHHEGGSPVNQTQTQTQHSGSRGGGGGKETPTSRGKVSTGASGVGEKAARRKRVELSHCRVTQNMTRVPGQMMVAFE